MQQKKFTGLESETGELILLEVCVCKVGKMNFSHGQES